MEEKYKILTIEAREIYDLMQMNKGFNIYDAKGNVNFRRFNSFLHNSLEMKQLKNAYNKAKTSGEKLVGKFEIGTQKVGENSYPATIAVINVVFNTDQKEYNKKKSAYGYVYILNGNCVDYEKDLKNHVFIKDGKLIAIEVPYFSKKNEELEVSANTYTPVEKPCEKKLLQKYFEYDKAHKCYVRTSKKIPVTKKRDEIREILYSSGFKLPINFKKDLKDKDVTKQELEQKAKKLQYVRYKRSAGSSREGNCLFILEPLYEKMMKWSACGLKLDAIPDKISIESYISLTLSNMQREIVIPRESILVIPDAVSRFNDEVVAIDSDGDKGIMANVKSVQVENSIWDGQGLLDESVFLANGCGDKGMMLLRNRFFKTCAFNTKLQKWFEDKGITSIEQLNKKAYTQAKSIKDIKLIVTDSSIKYVKLAGMETVNPKTGKVKKGLKRERAIEKWLENLNDDVFGLVKTEKKTKYMNGKMVKTSYQLLNTLDLSEEVEKLLSPSLEYLKNIQNDPLYMRHYISEQGEEKEEEAEDMENVNDGDEHISSMRRNIVLTLLLANDDFSKTTEYSNFRSQIKKAYIKELLRGHLLIDGTNATLFGNGYDMLCAVVDEKYKFNNPTPKALSKNEIRVKRFEDGQELLCARSPHITMGNLFIGKNVYFKDDVYEKYFNLTNEIVCVNSIGQNLLQRLNGCDFDSDMMLITDNPVMLSSAKKNYDKFLVPFCNISPRSTQTSELSTIDKAISDNKIGKIVNCSQLANSIFWDRCSKGQWDMELYREICKLAVLSGMEIDKAKRDYGVDAKEVLEGVKRVIGNGIKKPEFFTHISTSHTDGNGANHEGYTKDIHTSMQLISNYVLLNRHRSKRGENATLYSLLPKSSFDLENPTDNEIKQKNDIIRFVKKKQSELSFIRGSLYRLSDDEKAIKMQECCEIEESCVSYAREKMTSRGVMRLLINAIDQDKSVSSFRSLLLSTVCSANRDFINAISKSEKEKYQLCRDENGDIDILGYKHTKKLID